MFQSSTFAEQPTYTERLQKLSVKEAAATLFKDMLSFKDEAKFHEIGFAPVSPKSKYRIWFEALEALEKDKELGMKLLVECEFVFGDILMVGKDFMKSKGQDTNYTRSMVKTISDGLAKE